MVVTYGVWEATSWVELEATFVGLRTASPGAVGISALFWS
jgi:hypothetical protein